MLWQCQGKERTHRHGGKIAVELNQSGVIQNFACCKHSSDRFSQERTDHPKHAGKQKLAAATTINAHQVLASVTNNV